MPKQRETDAKTSKSWEGRSEQELCTRVEFHRNHDKANQNKELSTTVEFHEAGHLWTNFSQSNKNNQTATQRLKLTRKTCNTKPTLPVTSPPQSQMRQLLMCSRGSILLHASLCCVVCFSLSSILLWSLPRPQAMPLTVKVLLSPKLSESLIKLLTLIPLPAQACSWASCLGCRVFRAQVLLLRHQVRKDCPKLSHRKTKVKQPTDPASFARVRHRVPGSVLEAQSFYWKLKAAAHLKAWGIIKFRGPEQTAAGEEEGDSDVISGHRLKRWHGCVHAP